MPYSVPLTRNFRTAGSNSGNAHVFYNNNYVLEGLEDRVPDIYVLPSFSTSTGTYDYYGSDPRSIFVIFTRPSLSLTFTANTTVFTSDTRLQTIRQEIYKIKNSEVEQYRSRRDPASWKVVADTILNPLITYSAATSAITSAFTFSVLPDQFTKPENRYTEELFEDRDQYFINTRFVFSVTGSTSGATSGSTSGSTSGTTGTTITHVVDLDSDGNLISIPYSASTFVISNDRRSLISSGSWSGLTVHGLFFTCFQPPSKPIVVFPFVATAITQNDTFTPTFNFSNVEDGDKFVLEVTYDMSDTGFTNTSTYSGVTQYYRDKTDNSEEQTVDKTNTQAVGSERTTSLRIRRINAPIRPGSYFLYRIGNVKFINNIFDVEQKIINYSHYYTGATGTREVIRTYVDSRIALEPSAANDTQGNQGNGTQISPVR